MEKIESVKDSRCSAADRVLDFPWLGLGGRSSGVEMTRNDRLQWRFQDACALNSLSIPSESKPITLFTVYWCHCPPDMIEVKDMVGPQIWQQVPGGRRKKCGRTTKPS